MIYNIEQEQNNQTESKNKIRPIQNNNNNDNNDLNNFTRKCLVLIFAVSFVLIGTCSIVIAVIATRFFIFNDSTAFNFNSNSNNNNNDNHNSSKSETKSILNNNNNNNTKSERNSFNNWLKNKFNNKFFGFNLMNEFENQNEIYYPGCGIPQIEPHTINTRIMNGVPAVPHSWPYAISIAFEGPKGILVILLLFLLFFISI